MNELIRLVEEWAKEKEIFDLSNPERQLDKTQEELTELREAIELDCIADNLDEVRLELGDVLVTLIILAKMKDIDIEECLRLAYEKISKRTGKIIDGQFVKD
jgi:NTP pyrophosphatase (non-canonical NTP hydrolase)